MRVSVIIPTLNASVYIGPLIQKLKEQTLPPYEIIVVDSTSDDNTLEIARDAGAITLKVSRQSFDHGGTRNFAATHATGNIFAFITQDAIPSDALFLENLVKPFEDDGIAAAYGRQVAVPGTSPLEQVAREVNYPYESMTKSLADVKRLGIKTFFFTNVCSAIRSKVFRELRGFPEPIMSNEDMIIAAKCALAGYSIAYVAEARVDHSHDYTLKQVFGRYFDIGGSLRLHKWILSYVSAEGEGGRLMKAQAKLLMMPKMWRWIPRWIGESLAKYVGYRLGLMYHIVPRKLRPKCSMHPFFWKRKETTESY